MEADDGGKFRASIIISIIGGLSASTLLSPVFIPTLYSIMRGHCAFYGRIFSRFICPKENGDPYTPLKHHPALVDDGEAA
jgi:hypothetical protein